MPINLKISLGTVNFTDWLRVTASKVSAPTVEVYQVYIDVPVSNYNFIIPNLDPENYYIRYYDAATDSSLGTLVAKLIVNALTGEFEYERRFYTVDGPGTYDPAAGDNSITDPYLIGKNVTSTFKEGFRPFDPADEYTFDDTIGKVLVTNGTVFATDEKFIVDIKYNTGGASPSTSGGLYVGTLSVTEDTKTLIATDRNKRIRCVGTISTQVITLCSLSVLAMEDGFYFDNTCGGRAVQVKLLVDGGDRISYNGFMAASDLFDEFWVSKGEHLLIRKFDNVVWEVITDYKGVKVGSRMAGGYLGMPGYLPENGMLIDGDEYPRLWWWLNNILPTTHFISDDAVTDSGYVHPPNALGQFVLHSTLKKARLPNMQGMSERGLANFTSYGGDTANRPVDYPGGFQDQMLLTHSHRVNTTGDQSGVDPGKSLQRASNNGDGYGSGIGVSTFGPFVETIGGSEQRTKNIGWIYLRHI